MRDIDRGAAVYNTALRTIDPLRAITTVKVLQHSAYGNRTMWTPAAGNRIRIMGYAIETSSAKFAAAGELIATILEQGGTFLGQVSYGLGTAATYQPPVVVSFSPSGFLLTVDKPLVVDLSAGLTGGNIQFTAWGNEE